MAKSVCIVGAGLSGLCVARRLMEDAERNELDVDIQIFERMSDLGGIWHFVRTQEQSDFEFACMYEQLRTTLPREIMQFEGVPFQQKSASGDALDSFVPHHEMKRYLAAFAEPIVRFIRFNANISRIERSDRGWLVTVEGTSSSASNHPSGSRPSPSPHHHQFDAVFVCSGHFSHCRLPPFVHKLAIPWSHSKSFRRPNEFEGRKVAVVGAGLSAADVALQLAQHAKFVYFAHRKTGGRKKLWDEFWRRQEGPVPANVAECAGAVDVLDGGHTLLLEDGDTISDAETVIFATGYRHSLPFFDQDVVRYSNGCRVSPLFGHCVHVHFPNSLFFVGLLTAHPFLLAESQTRLCIALLHNRIALPPAELAQFEAHRIGELRRAGRDPEQHFHLLSTGEQWEYLEWADTLANGGVPPGDAVRRRRRPPVFLQVYEFLLSALGSHPRTYKALQFRFLADDEFAIENAKELLGNGRHSE